VITAVDLSEVIIVEGPSDNKKPDTISKEDIVWQENRRKRKVRKLDFDIK
jgi:5S rRNA maturation endonuclease (ribonuclease M5)